MGKQLRLAVLSSAAVLALAGPAMAVPTFVGRFFVSDGPDYLTNPTVYSCVEAAALLFGGDPSDYQCSTNPNTTDPNTIDNLAFLDGWADEQYLTTPQADTFKFDAGNPGYNDPSGFGTAYSAYVQDHEPAGRGPINYVWTSAVQASVPEPASLALLGMGIAVIGMRRRRRS